MIERKFIKENKKELLVEEFIRKNLKGVGHSMTKVRKTPLGEKIIIHSSRPGLVVGRGGSNIKKITKQLKGRFRLDNPQIEISEVENMNLDAQIIAEKIVNSLERFGAKRFKGIMHKTMSDVMRSGAKGVEILLSGKVPSSRAKTWRVYQGYLKKCGDVAVSGVKTAHMQALLKTGSVGIKVKIMPPDLILPDSVTIIDFEDEPVFEEVQEQSSAHRSDASSVTEKVAEEVKVEAEVKKASKAKKVAKKVVKKAKTMKVKKEKTVKKEPEVTEAKV